MFLPEYGFNNCEGLVEVTQPGQLTEFFDLDNGLGPHLPAFEIAPNFGLGDIVNAPAVESTNAVMTIFTLRHLY